MSHPCRPACQLAGTAHLRLPAFNVDLEGRHAPGERRCGVTKQGVERACRRVSGSESASEATCRWLGGQQQLGWPKGASAHQAQTLQQSCSRQASVHFCRGTGQKLVSKERRAKPVGFGNSSQRWCLQPLTGCCRRTPPRHCHSSCLSQACSGPACCSGLRSRRAATSMQVLKDRKSVV